MFTTVEEVQKRTGRAVTKEQIFKAQFVIEVYIGRTENDVTSIRDKEMLGRATIAQAVYMGDNYDQTYEQVSAAMISQSGSTVTFKSGDWASPFVAPLAQMACKNLSWKRSHNVSVGRTFQGPRRIPWERD